MIDLIGLFIFGFISLFIIGCIMFLLLYLIDKFLFKAKTTNWISKKIVKI